MTLIDIKKWYVVANFRETDISEIKPGFPTRIFILGDTSKKFQGYVDSISYGVAANDSVNIGGLPFIEKTINWVHVSQRFPVKIIVSNPDDELFRVGASAIVTVYKDKK